MCASACRPGERPGKTCPAVSTSGPRSSQRSRGPTVPNAWRPEFSGPMRNAATGRGGGRKMSSTPSPGGRSPSSSRRGLLQPHRLRRMSHRPPLATDPVHQKTTTMNIQTSVSVHGRSTMGRGPGVMAELASRPGVRVVARHPAVRAPWVGSGQVRVVGLSSRTQMCWVGTTSGRAVMCRDRRPPTWAAGDVCGTTRRSSLVLMRPACHPEISTEGQDDAPARESWTPLQPR